MSQEQLAFNLVDGQEPAGYPTPIWKREPMEDFDGRPLCEYELIPAEAPNELDEHRWNSLRAYPLSFEDFNRGITDNDIKNIKRLMIEELGAVSQGRMPDRYWEYTLSFMVVDYELVCWLE